MKRRRRRGSALIIVCVLLLVVMVLGGLLIVVPKASFDKEISDTDQVAFAVHVSEKLRTDGVVMAQVQNNPKAQAMKANLPGAAVAAIVSAMQTHKDLATKLLSDEATRGLFLDVVYEMLKRQDAAGLFGAGMP